MDMGIETVAIDSNHFPRYISSGYTIYDQPGGRHTNTVRPNCLLIFVTEGELYVTEENQLKTVKAGEWYLERPGMRLEGRKPCPKLTFYYVNFSPLMGGNDSVGFTLVDPGKEGVAPHSINHIPIRGCFNISEFSFLFKRLERIKSTTPNNIILLQGVFLELLSSIVDSVYVEVDAGNKIASAVMDYLTINFNKDVRLSELADKFHFSGAYLSKLMRINFGVSAKEYLQIMRIKYAKELLSMTDYPISKIGTLCGYSEETAFFRSFKDRTGTTPAKWRKNFGSK